MTAFNYAKSAATAARLIAKFGTAGIIRRPSNSGTEWNPTIVETDYACVLVAIEYTDQERAGTTILAGDKQVLVSTSGLSISPTTSDKIVIDGVVHAVINVDTLKPATTTVMWTIQARK